MTFTIWALPAHLVLVDGVVAGAGMVTIALAVSLSSMRFMPMVMALAPHLRASGGKPWQLLVAAHFIAITSWVYTLERLESIPRHRLLAFYMGLSIPLASVVTLVTGTMHVLAAALPPPLVAGIYFMTPLYFAMSLLKTSRHVSDRLALAFGFALGADPRARRTAARHAARGARGRGRGLPCRPGGSTAMTFESIDAAWWPFLFILLVGWLPSDLWRVVGTFASGWIEPDGELIVLVRAVANALVAAVIARLVFFPTGALAGLSALASPRRLCDRCRGLLGSGKAAVPRDRDGGSYSLRRRGAHLSAARSFSAWRFSSSPSAIVPSRGLSETSSKRGTI